MRSLLGRLRMRIRGRREMRRRRGSYQPRHVRAGLLPRTLPPLPGPGLDDPWPPRITPWVRAAFPVPGDPAGDRKSRLFVILAPVPG